MVPLCDVHRALGLDAADVGSSERIFVQGSYEYHHYGQGARDAGWGCAYRSCQTIFSWYKLRDPQRVRLVPSIKDMQRQLVHIGDKPASFYESTEWIGSVEISLLLDSMHGISCKILSAQNFDQDLPDQDLPDNVAAALVAHLRTVGSPMMVGGQGGGARAIIGAELGTSGKLERFLVLDPHYSGEDSLESLQRQSARVCVWVRPCDLCRQYGKFTNFCLPLPLNASTHGGGRTSSQSPAESVESSPGISKSAAASRDERQDEWHFEVIESS